MLLVILATKASVIMAVMQIRIMRMAVFHRLVHMRMGVRLVAIPGKIVRMLVMRVVPVAMVVR